MVAEIGARSMELELQYSALEEKYRTLRMYDFPVTDEEADMVDHMRERWEELVLKAKKRDHSLTLVKKEFTLVTQSQVSEFQKEVLELHGTFEKAGPNGGGIDLEQELERFDKFQIELGAKVKTREQLSMAQKLFNLLIQACLLYTSPSPRDGLLSRMPSSA